MFAEEQGTSVGVVSLDMRGWRGRWGVLIVIIALYEARG